MSVKIGDTFNNPFQRNCLCHVRGFVDDQVVVRWWRKGKMRWEYQTFDPIMMEFVKEVVI